MRPVYGDIFFAVNFVVDYVLLYATAYLVGRQTTVVRLVSGAGLGAFYALGFLHPPWPALYSPPVVLAFPVLMLCVGLQPQTPPVLGRLMITFYGLAMVTAGAALALAALGQGMGTWRGATQRVSFPLWGYLLVLLVVLVTAGAFRLFARRRRSVDGAKTVRVRLGGRQVEFSALVDTGLLVEDPLSGRPVVIVRRAVMERLLPELAAPNRPELGEALEKSGEVRRLRFIPYEAVGGKGVLQGVLADDLGLIGVDRCVNVGPVVVAIAKDLAAPQNAFEGLVGPGIYDHVNGREELA